MRVPKVISKDDREYILVKTYSRYALYEDMITGVKEGFTYHELDLIKEQVKPGPKFRYLMKL